MNEAVKFNFTLEQIVNERTAAATTTTAGDHKRKGGRRDLKKKQGFDTDIYDIRFFSSNTTLYLATCGQYIVMIYEVDKVTNTLTAKLSYCDQDETESFYCIEYSDCNNTPLLLTAGKNGTIKGLNCQNHELDVILQSHGNAINDLKVHPIDNALILSASKDESIRLFNIKTSVLIAIFSGMKGHRDEVLSIDIHLEGNCFVSSGMDNTIKIWNLQDPIISNAIDLSYTQPRRLDNLVFLTVVQQKPIYSNDLLHCDYVDCVRFVGNAILSKSTKNRVVLWLPDLRFKGAPVILREYATSDCSNWFTRFEICLELDIFALGNSNDDVSIFSISGTPSILENKPLVFPAYAISDDSGITTKKGGTGGDEKKIKERFESLNVFKAQTVLHGENRSNITRKTAFSYSNSGSYLAVACQDGTLKLWHISGHVNS